MDARQNLVKLIDEVECDHAPVHISRQREGGATVFMATESSRLPVFDLVVQVGVLIGNLGSPVGRPRR